MGVCILLTLHGFRLPILEERHPQVAHVVCGGAINWSCFRAVCVKVRASIQCLEFAEYPHQTSTSRRGVTPGDSSRLTTKYITGGEEPFDNGSGFEVMGVLGTHRFGVPSAALSFIRSVGHFSLGLTRLGALPNESRGALTSGDHHYNDAIGGDFAQNPAQHRSEHSPSACTR